MRSKRSTLATWTRITCVSLAKISKFESGDITPKIKARQMIVTFVGPTDEIRFITESPITEDERFDAKRTSESGRSTSGFEHGFFIGEGDPLTAQGIFQFRFT